MQERMLVELGIKHQNWAFTIAICL